MQRTGMYGGAGAGATATTHLHNKSKGSTASRVSGPLMFSPNSPQSFAALLYTQGPAALHSSPPPDCSRMK